jgi:lysozyme family protein
LQRLKTWPVFGKGWERRVREVEIAALGMAASSVASGTKDTGASITTATRNKSGPKVAGAVVIIGTAAATQAHSAGMSAALVLSLLMIAAGAAVAIIVFSRLRRRREEVSAS